MRVRVSELLKVLCAICLLFFLVSCEEDKISELDFLVGTWKVEGKEQYEYWEQSPNNELIGNSYKLVNNEKNISETLRIKAVEHQLIYNATVLNQNDGETIEFLLNSENEECWSFENEQHDFPKKIQYKKISIDSIKVTILGKNDQGFSYVQIKELSAN